MKIEMDNQNEIVTASFDGIAKMSDIIGLINASVDLAKKNGCYRILFDMTKAHESFSFIEEYDLNKNLLTKTKLNPDYRCAIIYTLSKERSKDKFIFKETVAHNWTQGIFRIFFKKNEGIKWVKLHTTKPKLH